MDFLLIIISLFLGYIQGRKHRRRKIKKELHKLNEEIRSLKTTLKAEQRKNRLSMFDVSKKIKGDQTMLEEKIVEHFSKYDSDLDFRKLVSLIQYIIDKWENDYISAEAQIKIKEINDVYQKFMTFDKSLTRPISVKLQCSDKKAATVPVRDIFPYVMQILCDIDIERYDISYEQFLSAMDNAANVLYK